jgi:hypothetical protein
MRSDPTILDAIVDQKLFAPWFKSKTWKAWTSFLAALFGLSMDQEQQEIYTRYTQRSSLPTSPMREGFLIVGRRGGKSFIAALVAVFLACFFDYKAYLSPGERGTVMLIAQDRKQARVLMRYISALLNRVDLLRPMIEKQMAESIDLTNHVTIEVQTCNFRAVRGYAIVAAVCDEIAFWRSEEAANPDSEILNALRPAMATIPNSMLLCLSSPYSRRGVLYQVYRDYYGKDTPTLVWMAETRAMNPTVPQRVVDEAYERDPASAEAEWGGQFRSDLQAYISREVLEGLIIPQLFEIPPVQGVSYVGFTDPAGGSGQDSMALGIAHEEDGKKILDALREAKPPFSPTNVVKDFADLLKRYRVGTVTGDRFAGEWARERFRASGIQYELADKPKSDLYRDLLPKLMSGEVQLLDHPVLIQQLVSLERRVGRLGKDSIDHAPGARDDLANVCAGVLTQGGGGGLFPELRRRSRNHAQEIQDR